MIANIDYIYEFNATTDSSLSLFCVVAETSSVEVQKHLLTVELVVHVGALDKIFAQICVVPSVDLQSQVANVKSKEELQDNFPLKFQDTLSEDFAYICMIPDEYIKYLLVF